jgi:hypothetical protein
MRPVTRASRWAWSRWAWGLCGLATAAALAVPGTRLILSAGIHSSAPTVSRHMRQIVARVQTRSVAVPQPVTSLNVQSYAGQVQVTAAPVTHVEVTETIAYFYRPPTVTQSVSRGRLLLADRQCANDTCSVSFAVKVPLGVTVSVTSASGGVTVSGTSGANVHSGRAPVIATNIHGPLTVSTNGGPLQINGLTGTLRADTAGGPLIATRVSSATAVVTTGSGPAQITFSAAPESVSVSTRGGLAQLIVPGGPYALTTNTGGALQTIAIATSSAAHRAINVTTGGGRLLISSGELPRIYGRPPVIGHPLQAPFSVRRPSSQKPAAFGLHFPLGS